MAASEPQRYAGVEDEFRVSAYGRPIFLDELCSGCQKFFFDESGHVPTFETVLDPETVGGRIWTWYGGTFYHDYDSVGPLVEATTPLTPLNGGIEALVDNVLTQRAELLELCKGHDVLGVSTHLNLLLDSYFQGKDLCEFSSRVPSNDFAYVEAQKLGADIALVATHTVSPVIAYLLFNRKPAKGAMYRPRKHRRMELCLPYVPEPDQMRAGFLFWFAVADHITELIKADLREHEDWAERYHSRDYYQAILSKFPFVVSDVKFRRPSFYLGYEIDGGVEQAVMERGSRAVIETQRGAVGIVDLAKAYVDFFSDKLSGMATRRQMDLLEAFLNGSRELNVDVGKVPKSLHLDRAYIERATGKGLHSYLNGHEVDELASVHLKFLRSPLRVIKTHSRISPGRIVRNLVKEIEWDFINLEIVEEREDTVRRFFLEIPLHQTEEYLSLEEDFTGIHVFLNDIKRWVKATSEIANPRSIFAYGTLMNPESDREKFGITVTSIRTANAYGAAYDFGDYPVLIEDNRTGLVPGVLLSLLDFEEGASKLDFYEGCSDPNPLFVRALRGVVLGNFETVMSWVYIGNMNNRLVRERLRKAHRLSGVWSRRHIRTANTGEF